MLYYKNLVLNVIIESENVEIIGTTTITVDSETFKEFASDFDWNIPYFDLVDNQDYEQLAEYYLNILKEKDVVISNDTTIIFLAWALDQRDNIQVDYVVDHIFWVHHDLLHAEYDVTSSDLYVTAGIEELRIIETLEYFIKNNEVHLLDYEFLSTLFATFNNRFGRALNLDENIKDKLESYYEDF